MPRYTSGKPAYQSSSTQPDSRFYDIIMKARTNQDLNFTLHDGTQFIWVGDLVKLYLKVIKKPFDRHIFHALSTNFQTWERIAEQAIEICRSHSKIRTHDMGWGENPHMFDVQAIKHYYDLHFSSYTHISEHLKYLKSLPIPEEYET